MSCTRKRINKPTLVTCTLLAALAGPSEAKPGVGHDAHVPPSTTELIRLWEAPERATWQLPDRVVATLSLSPGQSVADIGAGSGYFAVRFAAVVGKLGRVYAVNIDRELMAHVGQRARREKLSQLLVHAGQADSPALRVASIDLAFICDVLHHIDNPSGYLARLKPALRADGRLAIVEHHKAPGAKHGPGHAPRLSRDDVVRVALKAGFRLVAEYDFLPRQTFLVFN